MAVGIGIGMHWQLEIIATVTFDHSRLHFIRLTLHRAGSDDHAGSDGIV